MGSLLGGWLGFALVDLLAMMLQDGFRNADMREAQNLDPEALFPTHEVVAYADTLLRFALNTKLLR